MVEMQSSKVNCGYNGETQYYSALVFSSKFNVGLGSYYQIELCIGAPVRYITITVLNAAPTRCPIVTYHGCLNGSSDPFSLELPDYNPQGYIAIAFAAPVFLFKYEGRSPTELTWTQFTELSVTQRAIFKISKIFWFYFHMSSISFFLYYLKFLCVHDIFQNAHVHLLYNHITFDICFHDFRSAFSISILQCCFW